MLRLESQTAELDSFQFGPFRLSLSNRTLHRFDEFVPITPKAFEILLILVRNAGRVVEKEQLLQEVWHGTFVEEGSITNNIFTLRKILNPYFDGDGPIATIPRRGYRFTAAVAVDPAPVDVQSQSEPAVPDVSAQEIPVLEAPAIQKPPIGRRVLIAAGILTGVIAVAIILLASNMNKSVGSAVSSRRSVAVLAMKNLSGRDEYQWFSTALTETLSSELTAGGGLRMVTGENVARMQQELGPATGIGLDGDQLNAVGRNLGSDLVLTGNYLPVGGRIRVDLRLIDVATGETLASVTMTDEEKNLLDLVSRAGSELRADLGIAPLRASETEQIRESISANPQAARSYFEGLNALRLRDGPAAREKLSQAIAEDPNFALAHSALSTTWRLLGYDRRGAEEARLAFERGSRLPREEQLLVEARFHEASSNWTKAIEKYEALWNFVPDNIEYGLALGNVHQIGGKASDASKVIDQMKAMPPPMNADPRIDLLDATVADKAADYPKAFKAASAAAEKATAAKATLLLARARVKQGISSFRQGKNDDARRYFAESRRLFANLSETGGVADALRWDALVLMNRNQWDEASTQLTSALELSKKLDYVRLTTEILMSQSTLARQRGDLPAAEAASRAALSSARESDYKTSVAGALNEAGIVNRLQGNVAAARKYYEESLALYREIGEKANANSALNNIATIDIVQGRLADARRAFEELLPVDRQIGNKANIATRLLNLSRILALQGDFAGAEGFNSEECRIYDALGAKVSLNACRIRLAEIWLYQDRREEARTMIDLIHADLKIETQPVSDLARLATVHLALGDVTRASNVIVEAERRIHGRSYIPEQGIAVKIAAARGAGAAGRKDDAVRKAAEAKREAQKYGLSLLVLDARLAMAEFGNGADAVAVARDATEAGIVSIASKAQKWITKSRELH